MRFLRFLDGDVGFRDAGGVVRVQRGQGRLGGGGHVRLCPPRQGNHGFNKLVLRVGEPGGVLLHLVQEVPPPRIPELGAQLRIQRDLVEFGQRRPHDQRDQHEDEDQRAEQPEGADAASGIRRITSPR